MFQNFWLAFPSLTALLILSSLFVKADKRNILTNSKPLALLFVSLFCINSIEFSTYTNLIAPSLIMMKSFYAAVFFGILGIFLTSLKISQLNINLKKVFNIILPCLTVSLVILMLTTNLFVKGFEFIGYSYTRTPGNYYWIVQLYFPVYVFSSLFLLFMSSKQKKNVLNSKKAGLLLLSLSPIMIVGIVVLILMNIGISINASIIFPVFTTFFLIILIQTEKEESFFSLLIKIPFSKERKTYAKIKSEIQQFMLNTELSRSAELDTKTSLKALTTSIENLIVQHIVESTNGSQIQAASILGISASSICRKKKK